MNKDDLVAIVQVRHKLNPAAATYAVEQALNTVGPDKVLELISARINNGEIGGTRVEHELLGAIAPWREAFEKEASTREDRNRAMARAYQQGLSKYRIAQLVGVSAMTVSNSIELIFEATEQ